MWSGVPNTNHWLTIKFIKNDHSPGHYGAGRGHFYKSQRRLQMTFSSDPSGLCEELIHARFMLCLLWYLLILRANELTVYPFAVQVF